MIEMAYLTSSSRNITFVQQPMNVPPMAAGTFQLNVMALDDG